MSIVLKYLEINNMENPQTTFAYDRIGFPDFDGINTIGKIVLSILCLPIIIIGLINE